MLAWSANKKMQVWNEGNACLPGQQSLGRGPLQGSPPWQRLGPLLLHLDCFHALCFLQHDSPGQTWWNVAESHQMTYHDTVDTVSNLR